MNLSRKWLNEFVDLSVDEYDDKRFAEAMTVSGSKVEVTENLSETIKNVKVGRILSIEKHPNSDHMLVTQITSTAAISSPRRCTIPCCPAA